MELGVGEAKLVLRPNNGEMTFTQKHARRR